MLQLIPEEHRKYCRCYFCGTTQSVRYAVTINDPVLANEPSNVCCCSTCAIVFSEFCKDQQ